MVKPVPDTYHTVMPYLIVKGATQLVDFLKRAFGAKEVHLMYLPDCDAAVKDPSGNTWWMATHVEDVPPEELERRAADAARQRQS